MIIVVHSPHLNLKSTEWQSSLFLGDDALVFGECSQVASYVPSIILAISCRFFFCIPVLLCQRSLGTSQNIFNYLVENYKAAK